MLHQVSVITLGGGRRAAGLPTSTTFGKPSQGDVSTQLLSQPTGSIKERQSTLAGRAGTGTRYRVGMIGTARAGGNPQMATPTQQRNMTSCGGRMQTNRGLLGSGIRVQRLSISGTSAYTSRGLLGSQQHRGNQHNHPTVSSKQRPAIGQLGCSSTAYRYEKLGR